MPFPILRATLPGVATAPVRPGRIPFDDRRTAGRGRFRHHVHDDVVRLLRAAQELMQREGIAFAEVDIEKDASAADRVMQANGGNRTVPTLIFADGAALTNPSIDQVKAQLGRPSEA